MEFEDDDLQTFTTPIASGDVPTFKVTELNRPYRLGFVWWPGMEILKYDGIMTVDTLIEEHKKWSSNPNGAFDSPLMVRRFQAFDKGGAGYIRAKSEQVSKELQAVIEKAGRVPPKFSPKAATFVVQWPISKETMKPKSLETLLDEMAVYMIVFNKQKAESIRTMIQSGKKFTEHDLLIKSTEGPIDFQKYVPSDLPGSVFFGLIKVASEDTSEERKAMARQILNKILAVVANRRPEAKPCKDILLNKFGVEYTPDSLRAKISGASAVAAGSGSGIQNDASLMESGIDVEDVLATLTQTNL